MALEIALPVSKPFAPEISLLERSLLDHRAHRAIKNHDALGQEIAQGWLPVVGRIDVHKMAGYRATLGESTNISTYQDMLICFVLLRKFRL